MNEHLKATLGLDNGPFLRTLRGTKGAVSDFKGTLKSFAQGFAATFLVSAGKKLLDFAHTLKVFHDTTGLATDTIQTFRKMAGKVGVETEEADKAMLKFTVTLGEAESGTAGAVQTFNDLGVSIVDANGKIRNTEAVFNDTAKALGEIKNPAERARLTVELFGKAGAKVASIFDNSKKTLADYRKELGANGKLISDDDIDKLDQYSRKVEELKKSLFNFGVVKTAKLFSLTEDVGSFLGDYFSRDTGANESVLSVERMTKAFEAVFRIRQATTDEAFKEAKAEAEAAFQAERTAKAKRDQIESEKKLDELLKKRTEILQERGKLTVDELSALRPSAKFKSAQEKAAKGEGQEFELFKKLGIDPNSKDAMQKVMAALRNRRANGDPNTAKDSTVLFGSPMTKDLALNAERAGLVNKYEGNAGRLSRTNPQQAEMWRQRADAVRKLMKMAKSGELEKLDKQIDEAKKNLIGPDESFPEETAAKAKTLGQAAMDAGWVPPMARRIKRGGLVFGKDLPDGAIQKYYENMREQGPNAKGFTTDEQEKALRKLVSDTAASLDLLKTGIIVIPKNGP